MSPAAPARARWTVVALLCAMSFMSYFDRTIMGIAGSKAIQAEFRLEDAELGTILTAFSLVYAIFMIPGGRFVDRLGPRRALAYVSLGSGLFTALTAMGGWPALGTLFGAPLAFLLVRGLLGAFTAPLYPGCARANALWVPFEGRNLVQGLIAAGAGLSSAVAPVVFNRMIDRWGWRFSFVYAGLATLALGLLWVWLFRDRPAENHSIRTRSDPPLVPPEEPLAVHASPSAPWGKLLTSPHLLLLTTSYFATSYVMYIFFYWTFHYLKELRGLSDGQSALATLAVNGGWIVLSPLGGWASDRFTRRYGPRTGMRVVPVASLILSAVCLVLGVQCASLWLAVALLALSFGFAGSADGPYWAAAIRLGGRDVAAACAIMNTGGNLGGIGNWSTAKIADRFGWDWGLYSAAAVMVAGALLWLFIDVTRAAGGSDPRLDVWKTEPKIVP